MNVEESALSLREAAGAERLAGRLDEAFNLYDRAAQLEPLNPGLLHDRGTLFKVLGRLAESERDLRIAHRFTPTPHVRHALGVTLLSLGDYAEGWPLYEARHEVPELKLFKPNLPYAEWRGEDVAGKKLLIFPEQGLGDQIQFSRFAPALKARGADVTLMVLPPLAGLLADSLEVHVLSASGEVSFPDPDYWVMSNSLAGRFGATLDDLPNQPYLRARSANPDARIGVATRGNPSHYNDSQRSLPAAQAARLLSIPGAISLHPEDTGAATFAETAELVQGLDLVISVDTSIAHLAGALGKPVWILLPSLMTDWRWLGDRRDSPWYPTATLYRQSRHGVWDDVIDQVLSDL